MQISHHCNVRTAISAKMVSSGGSQRRTRRGQAAVEDLESTEVHEQTQQRNSKTRRSGPVAGPSALITEPDVKPIITHDQVFIDLDMLDAPSPAVTTATLAEDRIAQSKLYHCVEKFRSIYLSIDSF